MCIHFGTLIGDLCMKQIFSLITDKIYPSIAKMAYNNRELEKLLVPVLEYIVFEYQYLRTHNRVL